MIFKELRKDSSASMNAPSWLRKNYDDDCLFFVVSNAIFDAL